MRFVDQRMFGGLVVSTGGAELPTEIVHIARDPIDPEFDDDGVRAPRPAAYVRDQAAAARPGRWSPASATSTPTRRCGAPGCTASGRGTGSPGPVLRDLLGHVRDVMGRGAGAGRHVLRRALRQRQRRVRLLRPLPRRLRPGGRAVPTLRHPDPAGRLHEPLVLLLPDLPAPAARRDATRRCPLTDRHLGGTLGDGRHAAPVPNFRKGTPWRRR